MPLVKLQRDPSPRQVRQFALVGLPALLLVAAGWTWYRHNSSTALVAFAGCAVACLALGIVRPTLLRPLCIAWMWLTFPIGWIVAHTLMAGVYFLVIVPISLVMRIVGRDPLDRRIDADAATYWKVREPRTDPARYFRQY